MSRHVWLQKSIVGLLVGLAAMACPAAEPETTLQPRPGEIPPPMLGKLHGSDLQVDLGNYRGKVVIVTFWAS